MSYNTKIENKELRTGLTGYIYKHFNSSHLKKVSALFNAEEIRFLNNLPSFINGKNIYYVVTGKCLEIFENILPLATQVSYGEIKELGVKFERCDEHLDDLLPDTWYYSHIELPCNSDRDIMETLKAFLDHPSEAHLILVKHYLREYQDKYFNQEK